MAKGDSRFAVLGLQCPEAAGEYRCAVARLERGVVAGTEDAAQAAPMGSIAMRHEPVESWMRGNVHVQLYVQRAVMLRMGSAWRVFPAEKGFHR